MPNHLKKTTGEIELPDELIHVEGGTFQMGNDNGFDGEKPVHQVTVSDFYISQYPITVKQYKDFCHKTHRKMPKKPSWGWRDNHPIVNVGWEEAKAYCEWKKGRLPTEAEWEFAAMGGNKSIGYKYSGSDQAEKVAWYRKNIDSKTYVVGRKKANELNLFDMSGNVWEWCMDWYACYNSEPPNNPQGPTDGDERIQRGGSWRSDDYQLRVTNRRGEHPEYIYGDDVGFRLVKDKIEFVAHVSDEPAKLPKPQDKADESIISSLDEQIASLSERIMKLEEILKTDQQVASLKSENQQKHEPVNQKTPLIGERIDLKRLTELEQQWTMLHEKRSRLERDKIYETRGEEIERLEYMIQKINADCQKIEQDISELEIQLS
jgi:sulfatase modifying factor 1